jgi:hypothetical protein
MDDQKEDGITILRQTLRKKTGIPHHKTTSLYMLPYITLTPKHTHTEVRASASTLEHASTHMYTHNKKA